MAELDLAKLKVKLHLKDPFLGCIAMQVKWKETNTGTASTTGGTIYYSPSFFEDYDTAEQVAIIAHECMHIALQHTTRAETFNLDFLYFPLIFFINSISISNFLYNILL
mgnify:CR=1 FL=1